MTRHTFIAWALSEGANLKGLAEYCGTSVWAKETPLSPLFETQTAFARKLVERSVAAARNLWQLPEPHHTRHHNA